MHHPTRPDADRREAFPGQAAQRAPRLPGRCAPGVLVPLLALACDIPTELPSWDTRWVVPAENVAFPVADLLPAGVGVAPSGDAIEIDLAPVTFSRSLQQLCAACGVLDGLTAPKPPFTVSFGDAVGLPEGLVSARIGSGEIAVRLSHDFPFDPLRPAALARGYLVLTVRSGSVVLARDSLSGTAVALPPGTVLSRTLPLQAGTVTGPLEVGVSLHSPAGDLVAIDLDDRLTVAVPAVRVRVSDVRVRVSDEPLATSAVQLDLGAVDEAVADRVRSGAVLLRIENPFDLSGAFSLSLSAPGTTIVRALDIAPGTSQVRLELTGDEIRSLLGQSDVRLSVTGRASSPAAGTEVSPGDEIAVTARLELLVSTGSE